MFGSFQKPENFTVENKQNCACMACKLALIRPRQLWLEVLLLHCIIVLSFQFSDTVSLPIPGLEKQIST